MTAKSAGKTCNKCKKPNHFANVSRATASVKYTHEVKEGDQNEEQLSDFSYFIGFSDYVKTGDMTAIRIQDRDVKMMKDTGASLSLISTAVWKQLGSAQLTSKTSTIETNDNHRMNLIGEFRTKVTFQNKPFQIVLSVVQSHRQFGFLGRDFWGSIDLCCNAQAKETLPVVKGVCASIKLLDGATPRFCAPGKVPVGAPRHPSLNRTAIFSNPNPRPPGRELNTFRLRHMYNHDNQVSKSICKG